MSDTSTHIRFMSTAMKPDFLISVRNGGTSKGAWEISVSGDGVVNLPDGMTAEEVLLVVAFACGGGLQIPDADLSPALRAVADKWFSAMEVRHD